MFYDNVIKSEAVTNYHCTECAAQAIVVERGSTTAPNVGSNCLRRYIIMTKLKTVSQFPSAKLSQYRVGLVVEFYKDQFVKAIDEEAKK